MANLTAKQVTTWKNNVDKTITTNLVTCLKKINADAKQLQQITADGGDDDNLSYRFKDLAAVSETAAKALTTFMGNFDSSLTEYINKIKASEEAVAESSRQAIDNFAEAATKISQIKM